MPATAQGAPVDSEREMCSVGEVAARFGVDPRLIYAGVRRGEIKTVRIGHRILIPRVVVDRMTNPDHGPEVRNG